MGYGQALQVDGETITRVLEYIFEEDAGLVVDTLRGVQIRTAEDEGIPVIVRDITPVTDIAEGAEFHRLRSGQTREQ